MKIDKINSGYIYNKQNKQYTNPSFDARGVYPGSFDPITNGHLDIIKRASGLFDTLTVFIGKNPAKEGFLPVETRAALIKEVLKNEKLNNVEVKSSSGFTVDFAKADNDTFMVRGLRNEKDLDDEMNLFKINNKLNPEIDTIFFPTNPNTEMISSSVVRQIYKMKGNIGNFVPKPVAEFLANMQKS